MTKEAAIHKFFNSFGIPGYTPTSVPEDAVFPWLVYDAPSSAFEGGEMSITVELYYYTTDEAPPNRKAREIAMALENGVKLPCDTGIVWLKGPISIRPTRDEVDPTIKRRTIDITREDLTFY